MEHLPSADPVSPHTSTRPSTSVGTSWGRLAIPAPLSHLPRQEDRLLCKLHVGFVSRVHIVSSFPLSPYIGTVHLSFLSPATRLHIFNMADITDWSATGPLSDEWKQVGTLDVESSARSDTSQGVKDYMGGQEPDLGVFPDIQSLRTWITKSKEAMSAQMGPKIEGIKESDHQVPMRDGQKITCRVYAPESPPSAGSPLVVIYHGGGFCIGGLENEELLCRLLTSKLGATCVNVDYRLAPEHKFPSCAHDCIDATKWAASNASSIGADPTKGFVIGGTSAGGNLSGVVVHALMDEKINPPITGCHYMIPTFCHYDKTPEKYRAENKGWEQNKDAPILSRKATTLFMDNYMNSDEDKGDPLFSPLLWPSGHTGHPPATFQVCGADPLRDEAMIFERLLREDHGVKTKLYMYSGLPHGFWSVVPLLPSSKNFVAESVEAVQWLLQQK